MISPKKQFTSKAIINIHIEKDIKRVVHKFNFKLKYNHISYNCCKLSLQIYFIFIFRIYYTQISYFIRGFFCKTFEFLSFAL